MLRRPGPGSRTLDPRGPGGFNPPSSAPGERQSTPVYQRPERTVKEVTVRPGAPRLARDKVLHLMRDGCYHSAHELSTLSILAPGEWFMALQQLVEFGYAFDRRGNSLLLLLEKKPTRTPADDLARLLAGIDASKPDVSWGHKHRVKQEDDRIVERLGPDGQVDEGPSFLDKVLPDDDALRLSTDETRLPARASVTSTRAILARKSSGKTYLAMVIAEEYLRITAKTGTPMPFVVVDPTGVWYGLSSDDEGKPSPNKVLRLGGTHGNFSLEPEQGAVVARLITELWPHPMILDVSDMLPEDQHLFVADLGNVLYSINKKPVHLFVDEADEFIPQRVESGNKFQQRCLGVLDRMVRRGRVKGIGTTLITQRPAVLNKNALSQVDGIFVLSLSAPHDLEAIETWMRHAGSASDRNLCLQALPTLERGEVFFVQSNLKSGSLIKFTTREKTTFDSSRTPTVDDPEPDVALLSNVSREVLRRAAAALGCELKPEDLSEELPAVSEDQDLFSDYPESLSEEIEKAKEEGISVLDWKPEVAPEPEDEAFGEGSNDMGGDVVGQDDPE